MLAPDLFQKLIDENNLEVVLLKSQVREIINGGIIIESPRLSVTFKNNSEVISTPAIEAEKVEDASPTES